MAQKYLSCSDARELRMRFDHGPPEHSIKRQAALLGLPCSTFYFLPVPMRKLAIRIMPRIEALYLEDPCLGSRQMPAYPAPTVIPIRRDSVRNLSRCLGLRSIYSRPLITCPIIHSGEFLTCWILNGSQWWIGIGHCDHLHPSINRSSVPRPDHGSLLPIAFYVKLLRPLNRFAACCWLHLPEC